jgi:hypothetical protein
MRLVAIEPSAITKKDSALSKQINYEGGSIHWLRLEPSLVVFLVGVSIVGAIYPLGSAK